MEKKISYLNRTYSDYKKALIEMSEKYYPELSTSFEDASIAAWQIDVAADIADNLSYHIDRVYQETNINSAQEKGSLYSIARNNGVKIPGPKGAMAEVKLTITLPLDNENDMEPNWGLAPTIKRGTRFSSASQDFELLNDVNFAEQFDNNGNSDRTIAPLKNTNAIITGYTVSKLAVVTAGETKVYRHVVNTADVVPFMEILLPIENVMNVESIVVVDGTENTIVPTYGIFYGTCNGNENITRFYEVDNLAQNYTWTEKIGENGVAETYIYGYDGVPTYCITKGEWRPVEHKFITEYTDKGYLKIIFGASDGNIEVDGASSFSKWQMTRILNNKNLGILPKPNSTIFVLYRAGGGKSSNVPKGAINKVSYLNVIFGSNGDKEEGEKIIKTLTVENTTPSVSGKDMPNEKELKYLIKYNNAAQERCVTLKDYVDRILMMPPKYGTPFRVGVTEENNKIMIYVMGINSNGKLDASLPVTLIKNIEDYLSGYKMINDYIEIKAGRIINLSFNIKVVIDKNYNTTDVIKAVYDLVVNYMDVNKHLMGEKIFVGDIYKEICKLDGILSVGEIKVYNETEGDEYSKTTVSQEINYTDDNKIEIDLISTHSVLYNDGDTMMEIKNPKKDIRIESILM